MDYKINIFCIVTFCLILTGCESHEQKFCKNQIERSLLNPESLDFKEFNEISFEQFAAFENWSDQEIDRILRENPNYKSNHFFYNRFQAQGKLGNEITDTKYCIYFKNDEGENCNCWAVE